VFTRTKRGADKVTRMLEGGGVASAAIHGNKSQAQREKSLAAFKAGSVRALVATDIAARGIDISSVSHVVQFELPDVPEQYVHRIGRTARAGKDGSAVAFCAEDERSLLRDIERVTRQKIPSVDRRSDAALAQLTANANMEEKRGAKAEPRGEPQPRRQSSRDGEGARSGRNRRGKAGAPQGQRQQQPRNPNAQAREGQRNEGQRTEGQRQENRREGQRTEGGNRQDARNQNPRGQRPNGQKQPHRKGQGNREQAAPRGDVMNTASANTNARMPSASELMRALSAHKP
jgi:ATP-dependent RNA helicase RhlE